MPVGIGDEERRAASGAVPARKQPSRRDSRAKLEKIIEATIALIETNALPSLTMNMIATEAEISRTSVYDFFPTVLAIFEEVARRHVMHSWYHIREATRRREPSGLMELLDALIDAAVEYFNNFGAARKTLLGTAALELHIIENDFDILAARMYREFYNPPWSVEPFSIDDPFRTIAILQNTLYSTSVQRHGFIEPYIVAQAKLMSRSYFTAWLAEFEPHHAPALIDGEGRQCVGPAA